MSKISLPPATRADTAKFFSLFLLLLPCISRATDYYVAKTGNDVNPGTLDQPFLTIQKAADRMVAGDRCHIRRGTYRETVIPAHSGSAGLPIVFMPCNKERVVISGTEVITGWTNHEWNVYKAPMDWSNGKVLVI